MSKTRINAQRPAPKLNFIHSFIHTSTAVDRGQTSVGLAKSRRPAQTGRYGSAVRAVIRYGTVSVSAVLMLDTEKAVAAPYVLGDQTHIISRTSLTNPYRTIVRIVRQ